MDIEQDSIVGGYVIESYFEESDKKRWCWRNHHLSYKISMDKKTQPQWAYPTYHKFLF